MLQEKTKYDFSEWLEDFDHGDPRFQYSLEGIDKIFNYLEGLQDQGDELIKDLSPTDIRMIFNEYPSLDTILFDVCEYIKEDIEGLDKKELIHAWLGRESEASMNGREGELLEIEHFDNKPSYIIASWINH